MAAYLEDTIAAVATPPGAGAVAIVRISGRDAVSVAGRILRSARGSKPLPLSPSHRARLGRLHRPGGGEAIDQVLVLPMLAPASFTGEDVVEIHCHGGVLLADVALRAALEAGARAARPGEFTERAFLNGRLDLCQAEAVADLVTASSEAGLTLARRQLDGLLSEEVLAIRDLLLDARALVEAHLDFPEDDVPDDALAELAALLAEGGTRLDRLVASYARGRLARRGARVVLTGRPNSGKSSLMNALLGRERAIVSTEAGTTRDYLEEPLAIGPLELLLVDTAGMRSGATSVERAGIDRTRALIEAADVVVVLLDRSGPLAAEDREVLAASAGRPRVLVRSKADLPSAWEASTLALDEDVAEVSAHTGAGLAELSERIVAALPGARDGIAREEIAVTRARHHAALVAACAAVASAATAAGRGAALDLVAADLQSACTELEGLVGVSTPEDVLDRIFRKFCVGK